MSGIVKGVKKVFKGVGKAIKGIGKGILKFAKKAVGALGRFMGKLGPIGTIAMAVIAPYALPAMAGSSVGWISALGKGLTGVQSMLAAPFKAAGGLLQSGLTKLGGQGVVGNITSSLSKGLSTLTGGSGSTGFADGMKQIFEPVSDVFNAGKEMFGANPLQGTVADSAASAADMTQFGISESTMEALKSSGADTIGQFGSDQMNMLQAQDAVFAPEGYAPTGINKSSQQYNMLFEQESGQGSNKNIFTGKSDGMLAPETQDALSSAVTGMDASGPSLLSKVGSALAGLGGGEEMGMPQLASVDANMKSYGIEGVTAGGAQGSGGRSFSGQDRTGLLTSEDFVRQQQSLLAQRYGIA